MIQVDPIARKCSHDRIYQAWLFLYIIKIHRESNKNEELVMNLTLKTKERESCRKGALVV